LAIQAVNPTTGEVLQTYAETPAAAVRRAIERSHDAFRGWSRASFAERGAVLLRAAALLRERRDEWARLAALEMGKPIAQGRAEVEKSAWTCEYYAEHAARMLADEVASTEARRSFVHCAPLGVILAVMPWNFPFWQVFRFAAPALMAGNGVLLKHASNVPGCALAIDALLRDAGLPDGLLRALLVGSGAVEAILDDARVAAVTLTGSTEAGRAIAAAAGRRLKKSLLELGGSDAYVVLEDADVDAAARACASARLVNSGQSCIAAKRFVVVDAVRAEFVERVADALAAARVGDPLDEKTDVGPLARLDLRDELHAQVSRSLERGARCRLGGAIPAGRGAFYPPTLLVDVGPGMPAYGEELFGPVAAVIAARDELDAIRIANDSPFGLGAAVFTRDPARGERIARDELEAGACFVNATVRSDPRLPFGGIKQSGYGRELSHHGIREFVNLKTVWVG
jgi:succinate-semialdehyde dehydrogenase/glutarate-semialdehyde dehydrogenase